MATFLTAYCQLLQLNPTIVNELMLSKAPSCSWLNETLKVKLPDNNFKENHIQSYPVYQQGNFGQYFYDVVVENSIWKSWGILF